MVGSLCCPEGLIKPVKRHMAFLTVIACHRLCSRWCRTSPLGHTWAAGPGLGLGRYTGCLGPTQRSCLQSEALYLLSGKGLPRPFPPSPSSVDLIHWSGLCQIIARGKDSNQIPPDGKPTGCHHPSPSEGFTSCSVLPWHGFPSDFCHQPYQPL